MPKQVHTNLADEDYELSPAPIGPGDDGILGALPPQIRTGPAGPTPPRLCVVGPCANYHRFVVQADSQGAIDGSRSPVYLETRHYCYPGSGLELDMCNKPIFECSRWRPIPAEALVGRDSDRERALKSLDGQVFQRQLDAFMSYREEINAEAQAAVEYDLGDVLKEVQAETSSQADAPVSEVTP